MRAPATAAIGALVALAMALACNAGPRSRAERIVLRAPLEPVFGARLSWSFTVAHSGTYDVCLEFPLPIEEKVVAGVVQRAANGAGQKTPAPAEFAFSWQVLEGANEVARGSGQDGVTFVTDVPAASGSGGDSGKSRVLVFGSFPAKAGVAYSFRLTAQPGFETLIPAKPIVVLELRSAS